MDINKREKRAFLAQNSVHKLWRVIKCVCPNLEPHIGTNLQASSHFSYQNLVNQWNVLRQFPRYSADEPTHFLARQVDWHHRLFKIQACFQESLHLQLVSLARSCNIKHHLIRMLPSKRNLTSRNVKWHGSCWTLPTVPWSISTKAFYCCRL
jgi:hypothetical protein